MNWLLQLDWQFIIVQAIGFAAWIFLFVSYYRENTNRILALQIISSILYIIHYLCLGAYTGLYVCILEVVVNYLYVTTDKDFYIFLSAIPLYIGCGFITYESWPDVLPIVASVIESFSLINSKKRVIIGAIFTYSLWVAYDLLVGSYSGVITDGLVALSNVSILVFHYNFLKRKDENPVFLQR